MEERAHLQMLRLRKSGTPRPGHSLAHRTHAQLSRTGYQNLHIGRVIKTRLLNAWENSKNLRARKSSNGNSQKRVPTKKEHAMFHSLLSKVHRRALLSGLVTSGTSSIASLALLLPLVLIAQPYSVSVSILLAITLLSLLRVFR